MFLRTWGGNFKSANHKQDWVRKVSHLRKVRNLLNYLSPQVNGFPICGTYLRMPTSVDIIKAEHAVLYLIMLNVVRIS
jgi:hypothetical protein